MLALAAHVGSQKLWTRFWLNLEETLILVNLSSMGPPEISLTKRLTSDVIGALSDERKTV